MRNNLSPEAAPWGREIETRLRSAENTLKTISQDSSNALSGIAASLAQLSTQVSDVQTALSRVQRNTSQVFWGGDSPGFNIPAATTSRVFVSAFTQTVTIPPYCNVLATYFTGLAQSRSLGGPAGTANLVSGVRLMVDAGGGFSEQFGSPQISQTVAVGTGGVNTSLGSSTTLPPSGPNPSTLVIDVQVFGSHSNTSSESNHAFLSPQLIIQTIPYN